MLATIKNIDSVYWYRLQQGESAALGFLYDTYADKLFLSAMRLTDDRELAKDAVQEVFIELWNYRLTISEIKYSQGYLIKVLRSILFKRIKRENLSDYHLLDESTFFPEQDIESILIDRESDQEKIGRLNFAFSKLSERQKQVLKLHFYNGLSYELIAAKLNINYQSVNNLCFRSILRLRNLLYVLLCGIYLYVI